MVVFSSSNTKSSRLLYHQAASLLIFQGVFKHPIGEAFLSLLHSLHGDQSVQSSNQLATIQCLEHYGRWFRELAIADLSWQDFLGDRILKDDNPFSQKAQHLPVDEIPKSLREAAYHDLITLQNIYRCDPCELSSWVKAATQVPAVPVPWQRANRLNNFLHHAEHWGDTLDQLAGYYHRHGVGIFAQYQAFRWENNQLLGICDPDYLSLEDIVGYDDPKQILVNNTECLVAGLPALNILLYGSRGSGKSSMIKALLGPFAEQGLRLVEVDKIGLHNLPMIVEQLRHQTQKFILFVDDLSFEEDDDAFKSLKVVLEGGVRSKANNIIVYATSNRRHLVREFFEDRPRPRHAEEIHQWDTVQEKLSFSDRFGLTLTFEPANQNTYLEIVHHLARKADLDFESEELEFRAKQWATRHNGRSGRTAQQFIDFLQGEQYLISS